jgi:hypothetical protein
VTLSLAELADPEQAVGIEKLTALLSFGMEFHRARSRLRRALPYLLLAGAASYLLWQLAPIQRALRRTVRKLR